jgi:hypothetical protein
VPTVLAALFAATLLVACSAAPAPGPGFAPRVATFDASTDGWTSSEDQPPAWEAPGVLVLVDDAPGWYRAIAPAGFHGDWRAASRVDLRVRADDGGVVYPLRLELTGAGRTLVHAFALDALAAGAWRSLGVDLVPAAWRVDAGEDAEGDPVDAATFAAVLADVEGFAIRVDLNDAFTGDERNLLDDVEVR